MIYFRGKEYGWHFFATILSLILPAVLSSLLSYQQTGFYHVSRQLLVALLFFLVPLIFFYRNVRIYFYLLFPLILLTPLFLFSILSFRLPPGYQLMIFIFQTNPREAIEAAGPFLAVFIPFTILYVLTYLFCVKKIKSPKISLKGSGVVSVASFLILTGIVYYENRLFKKSLDDITRADMLLPHDYPFSLLSGLDKVLVSLQQCNLEKAEDFYFHATRKDTIHQRQVYVLIIGESSRYDRWQVNGYERPTSPRLAAQKNLITFSDVISGAYTTKTSVPQIITRASPDNFDLQFQEKSILSAFKEASFKTVWLSNQSDKEILRSGSIIMHAKTADVSIFSPTYAPNLYFDQIYDERLLPVFDSILRADKSDLFFVLHTMGNHWDYSRRYPPEFDLFRPSGQSIMDEGGLNREAILNSYDNSIVYADWVIDRLITIVKSEVQIAAVTFVSDHGEDLFDVFPDKLNFHFRPSEATLRIPLFIWTSDGYNNVFPENRRYLENNRHAKVGSENLFFTVLDIANITFKGFDFTKSLASPGFLPSAQKFYDGNVGGARSFAGLQ